MANQQLLTQGSLEPEWDLILFTRSSLWVFLSFFHLNYFLIEQTKTGRMNVGLGPAGSLCSSWESGGMTGPWGREYSKAWPSHLCAGEAGLGTPAEKVQGGWKGPKDQTMGIATSGKAQKSSGEDQQVAGRRPCVNIQAWHTDAYQPHAHGGCPRLWFPHTVASGECHPYHLSQSQP